MVFRGWKLIIVSISRGMIKESISYYFYVDDMLIVGHDKNKINRLKKDLGSKFTMKDFGPTQQTLGIRIMHNKKNKRLWLSQEKYIKKVLDRFNMKDAKLVGMPLTTHFKLSTKLCPSDDKEKEEMRKIPWQFDVCHGMHMTGHCIFNGSSE